MSYHAAERREVLMPVQYSLEPIRQYHITHSRTTGQLEPMLHSHQNAYELYIFKAGKATFYLNGNVYHLRPGDIMLIRPNDIHGYLEVGESLYERASVHLEDHVFDLLSSELTDLLACFSPPEAYMRHLDQEQTDLYIGYVDDVIKVTNEKSYGWDVRMRADLTMILLMAYNAPLASDVTSSDTYPKMIQDVLTYINENFTNDISVQSIAAALNVSRSRICHVFKDFMGTSLWNYVITRRIQYSRDLLRSGMSITDACYECGFQSYAHFSKEFKKVLGVSPGRYIKEGQTGHENTPGGLYQTYPAD